MNAPPASGGGGGPCTEWYYTTNIINGAFTLPHSCRLCMHHGTPILFSCIVCYVGGGVLVRVCVLSPRAVLMWCVSYQVLLTRRTLVYILKGRQKKTSHYVSDERLIISCCRLV